MEGKWELTVHTYMGDMRSHMEYHVEGNVLTGTGEDASNGAVAQIENGRFENGEFSYDLTIKTAVGEMTNHLSGKVEGRIRCLEIQITHFRHSSAPVPSPR